MRTCRENFRLFILWRAHAVIVHLLRTVFCSKLHSSDLTAQLYSSFTRRWLSVSMKLPRDLVLLFRPKVRLPDVVLSLEVAPAKQKNTVARKRQAIAAQMKPKAICPSDADWPLARKLFRPMTKFALPNR